MIKIAIIPADHKLRAEYLDNIKLPINYMSDFSIMGFVVDRYNDALALLISSGYKLDKLQWGVQIDIQSSSNITEINDLFLNNRIICDYSDIVDSLYQA